jgi:hypothetical protein
MPWDEGPTDLARRAAAFLLRAEATRRTEAQLMALCPCVMEPHVHVYRPECLSRYIDLCAPERSACFDEEFVSM